MNFRRVNRQEEPEINLIPLIDVVLVIVIFLVMTTTFSTVSGLEINLPTSGNEGSDVTANQIDVAVSASGDVLVNRQPVGGEHSIDQIAAALQAAVTRDRGEPVIVISADAKAAHQSVIDVMQAAQQAGLVHVTFATQTPPK